MKITTPILLLIFNRPSETFQVFERIRAAQPTQLFIAADGPRKNKPGEVELCAKTRSIADKIDWECEVKKLFREENLGCAKGVSTAIDWFFEHVEQGIILEDDCLPDLSFFTFCDELLNRYKNDKEIGAVCGFNNQLGISRTKYSYYFAQLFSSWGWATWADRWTKYIELPEIPDETVLNHPAIFHWKPEIIDTFNGKIDSWAYRWQYAFRKNNFLSIYPDISLIKNIGFASENAAHTKQVFWWEKYVKYGKIETLKHPPTKQINKDADTLMLQLAVLLPIGWKDRIHYKWISLKIVLTNTFTR